MRLKRAIPKPENEGQELKRLFNGKSWNAEYYNDGTIRFLETQDRQIIQWAKSKGLIEN